MNVRTWHCTYTHTVENPVDNPATPDVDVDDDGAPLLEEPELDDDDDDPDPDDATPVADDQPGEDPPVDPPAEG